ncbi:hypothetical protein AAES_162735 [Amazona aestiva]|uniref:Uncharacterized protein n=1 Tax=Amazona aestiva TaxID=12930 RepID=A0A0Q3LU18_AMAAE|nr:hypothetical protein AAES_162735 [Amazona aestiva]
MCPPGAHEEECETTLVVFPKLTSSIFFVSSTPGLITLLNINSEDDVYGEDFSEEQIGAEMPKFVAP